MHSLDNPATLAESERFSAVAAILATGYLCLRCRRGHVPATLPAASGPPTVASGSPPENSPEILRN
jgi:hypothetical protein